MNSTALVLAGLMTAGAGMAMVRPLGEACESALALSAAPAHLRSGAGVYVLKETGYALVRESSNGFTCIVNRDHPASLKPTCFDVEGTRTIIPKIVFWGAQLQSEVAVEEIRKSVAAGFDTGRFESPARPGVAYMLSWHNRPWTGAGLGWFPPHVMFYAPNLTPADIGFSPEASSKNPRLPFIAYPGPQAYMITVTGPADADEARVPTACESVLDPPPDGKP